MGNLRKNHPELWDKTDEVKKDLNDAKVECLINRYGLNAPRVTPDIINKTIKDTKFIQTTDVLTICILTLQNGFTVTGESTCASPENFNQEIGEGIALKNAKNKIWMLKGYLLKEELFKKEILV